VRLELGAGLEVLARVSGHHELGFSSLEAYALERCERSARWVQESRSIARRLEALPAVRKALITGAISFSMAQVIGKAARSDDEWAWLAEARVRTVREMRQRADRTQTPSENGGRGSDVAAHPVSESAGDELVTLTVTVDREDAWLFECARMVCRQISGLTESETLEALLGEGTSSLLVSVPRNDFADFDSSDDDVAQRQWEAELARWREDGEARCEKNVRERMKSEGLAGAGSGELRAVARGHLTEGCEQARDASALDAKLRQIAGELSRRDLALGQLADAFAAAGALGEQALTDRALLSAG